MEISRTQNLMQALKCCLRYVHIVDSNLHTINKQQTDCQDIRGYIAMLFLTINLYIYDVYIV
jgi:hypothetical protein